MTIVTDKKQFWLAFKKEGGRIVELTVKLYYTVPEYEKMTDEQLFKEWFEKYGISSFHAYRDANACRGTEVITSKKMLSEYDIEQMD